VIISRYLTKEVLNTLLAVTFVLLLIFLSNALVRYLGYAAAGKLAANILFQLMSFEIPYLLALLLPLGLYLGIILAYGRMYADSEMRVLHACGLSTNRLIAITSMLAFVISIVVLALTLWVNPWLASQKKALIAKSLATDNVLDNLMPGRFQVSGDGKRVLYVERISSDRKQVKNLFLADQGGKAAEDNADNWSVVSAKTGSQLRDPTTQDRFMVATNGNRYDGMPGRNDFKIIQFKTYAVRIPQAIANSKRQDQEAVPSNVLWRDYQKPQNAAELQWRLSIPLSALILSLLAIPLSQVRPRYGRYSQLFPAILIYIVYVNLLFVARNWIEQDSLLRGLGMGWIHLLALFFAIVFVMWQTGWRLNQLTRRFL